LLDDATADGALKLLQTQIEQEIADLTGTVPAPDGKGAAPASVVKGPDGEDLMGQPAPQIDDALLQADMGEADLRTKLVTEAYGTVLPQRRVPTEYEK